MTAKESRYQLGGRRGGFQEKLYISVANAAAENEAQESGCGGPVLEADSSNGVAADFWPSGRRIHEDESPVWGNTGRRENGDPFGQIWDKSAGGDDGGVCSIGPVFEADSRESGEVWLLMYGGDSAREAPQGGFWLSWLYSSSLSSYTYFSYCYRNQGRSFIFSNHWNLVFWTYSSWFSWYTIFNPEAHISPHFLVPPIIGLIRQDLTDPGDWLLTLSNQSSL